jgi:hypothetical protein
VNVQNKNQVRYNNSFYYISGTFGSHYIHSRGSPVSDAIILNILQLATIDPYFPINTFHLNTVLIGNTGSFSNFNIVIIFGNIIYSLLLCRNNM